MMYSETFIIVIVAVLLLVAMVVFLLVWIDKLTIQKLKLEQEVYLSQLKPHFVFNSLTAIQCYIFKNDSHLAGKYLSNFAKLIRNILDNSKKEFIPITKEVETLRYYLDLQVLRFEDQFKYQIDINEEFEIESFSIPPLLEFPFVENAIEHGVFHISGGGMMKIKYSIIDEAYIQIDVEVIGEGINESLIKQVKLANSHLTSAYKTFNERLVKIRRCNGLKIHCKINDLTDVRSNVYNNIISITIPIKKCILQ